MSALCRISWKHRHRSAQLTASYVQNITGFCRVDFAMDVKKANHEYGYARLMFDKMIRIYIIGHKMITILPLEGRDLTFFATRLLTLYLIFFSVIHWSMFVVYCFNTNVLEMEVVSLTVLVIGTDSRFYIMLYYRKEFAAILEECRLLYTYCNEEGRQLVLTYERKLRVVYVIFYVSACLINVTYAADALMTPLPPLKPNTTRKALPYKWYADNTENNWPGYWVVFVAQLISVQNTITYAVNCDSAVPLLAMLCAGYFRHLQDRLVESQRHPDPKQRKNEMIRCIWYHQRLLKFGTRLARFSNTMFLIQILSTGYNISLILIKLVSSGRNRVKYLTVLGFYICQLHLVQWAPDNLHDESEGVAFGAYYAYIESLNSGELSKYFLTILHRAQQPVQLLAGSIFMLSIENFGNMMKSAFSFFTLLRNLDW